jgi:hypothetical protein
MIRFTFKIIHNMFSNLGMGTVLPTISSFPPLTPEDIAIDDYNKVMLSPEMIQSPL